jgi:hypothetical protein
VNGTKVSGSASCVGKCKVVNKSFPAQAISKSVEPYGQFFMDTTINTAASKQRGTGRSVASWTFTNSQWAAPSEPTKHSTVDVRCDNALPGAPRQVGCVNLQAVPVISYSLTGPWPEVADHIKDAQATGLPGKYGTTNFLTRLTDQKKIKENRNKACPSSLQRPPGKSCDEYAFASTWQGAKYGSGKFSRRMIDAGQNTNAGKALRGRSLSEPRVASSLVRHEGAAVAGASVCCRARCRGGVGCRRCGRFWKRGRRPQPRR